MSDSIVVPDPESDRQTLELLGALALDEAKKLGASAAELSVGLNEGLSVKARQGDVDTVEHNRDKSMGVTVFLGQCSASASSTDFSETAVRETVAAAVAIARYTSADEYAGLADPEQMTTTLPDLDLYHPWEITPEEMIEKALVMESAAREFDERITNIGAASISHSRGVTLYCNSTGFAGSTAGTRHGLSCSAIAGEGATMQRDHWYSAARVPGMLERPEVVGLESARRAVARLGARPVKTGRYPVLFSADMTRGLLGQFISSISGSALYRRSTFMLDKLGDEIFANTIRISELPLIPQALGSSSFDSDGLPRRDRDIVRDGVLQGYVLSTYSARKLGMESTANAGGVRNLTLHPGKLTEQQLIKALGTGLIVTEMMGQGGKMATGDYSRGAAGLWVENGEIQHAVQEITIAGNMAEMFKNISAVGSELDLRGSIRTPAVLIGDMTIAGK